MDLDRVDQRHQQAEARIRADVLRLRAQQQQEQISALQEAHAKLKGEADQMSLPVPEQREIYLEKVKSENANILELEAECNRLRQEIQGYKKQTSEMMTDIEEKKGETGDQHKYELLCQRDEEISEFMDAFPATKQQEEGGLVAKRESIVEFLCQMSRAIQREKHMPEARAVREKEGDLTFKEKQFKNSEVTLAHLRQQLERRQGELDKITSLDAKINEELTTLQEKREQYTRDMEYKYNDVEALKQEGSRRSSTFMANART